MLVVMVAEKIDVVAIGKIANVVVVTALRTPISISLNAMINKTSLAIHF
ncbi:hypothetical protein [Marininema halotolerans]|nr:hypothetical protein [Marininema halotolerans]